MSAMEGLHKIDMVLNLDTKEIKTFVGGYFKQKGSEAWTMVVEAMTRNLEQMIKADNGASLEQVLNMILLKKELTKTRFQIVPIFSEIDQFDISDPTPSPPIDYYYTTLTKQLNWVTVSAVWHKDTDILNTNSPRYEFNLRTGEIVKSNTLLKPRSPQWNFALSEMVNLLKIGRAHSVDTTLKKAITEIIYYLENLRRKKIV